MKYLTTILMGAFISGFAQSTIPIGFDIPPGQPALFAEGTVSTYLNERDFAISPDGNEIYYTVSTPKSTIQTILVSRQITKGNWTQPEVASFAGTYSDLEPALSADGNTLYFASNRPLTGTKTKDFDIWKVTRVGNGWGAAEPAGKAINTEADEFFPSLTRSGDLYFTAAYAGGPGREDIYVSRWKDGSFQKAVALDTAVNSRFYEFNAFVDPGEQFILFTSYGRKDDTGGGDLYVSIKSPEGKWMAAENLKAINSKQLDYCPYISPDGKIFFFTSERHNLPVSFTGSRADIKTIRETFTQPLNGVGNIYWVKWNAVFKR